MSQLIETIARAIQDKKGKNIVALDLSGFDGAVCPAFVICNADSTTQVEAISRYVEEQVLEKLGEKVWRVEGLNNGDILDNTELRDKHRKIIQQKMRTVNEMIQMEDN